MSWPRSILVSFDALIAQAIRCNQSENAKCVACSKVSIALREISANINSL